MTSTLIINQFAALIKLDKNFPENLSRLKEKGDAIIEKLGLTVVGQNHFEFTPQGITLAYILSQSHLVLHTWPELNVLHVDLMTLNGSKIYGPKGVGILYKRRTVALRPLIVGGGQEMHVRAGTENVPGIVGFAKALELAQNNKQEENMRLSQLRAYFWERIVAEIFDEKLNGPELGGLRLPNNLNVSFNGIEGEALVFYIDEYGVSASTGSACTSADAEPSHVMRAMGLSFDRISSSVRFTMGKRTTSEDIDYVMQYLPGVVAGLRESFIFQKGNHKKVAS